MIIRKDFSNSGEKSAVCLTIGFFDGVHRGHKKIIKDVVEGARLNNLQSCIVSFHCHPNEFFSGRPMKFLTSWEEKEEIFQSLGVDLIQVFTFNSRFASLSPEQFLQKLSEIFYIHEILVGEGFNFGRRKEGNISFLYKKQSKFGYRLRVIPYVKFKREKVSSSLLRRWLEEGKIQKVARGLGHYPTLMGKVTCGRGKGREIGYPTANIESHPEKLLPPGGVYVGYVELGGKNHKALINIGARPTFGDLTCGVEVHIINFNNQLYEKMLKVYLVEKIRDIVFFPSPAHLSQQLERDKEKAEQILNSSGLLEKAIYQ
ncbi:bifunctional riboflavin kinase/FAD synthetase [Candidatus Aerophobetes bacterium]|nr:bifunctional riboflavin kinase/FAD synthetase [Candidatus Aerophobetes bacterium]